MGLKHRLSPAFYESMRRAAPCSTTAIAVVGGWLEGGFVVHRLWLRRQLRESLGGVALLS